MTRVELVRRPELVVPIPPAAPPARLAEPAEPARPPRDRIGVRQLTKLLAVVVVVVGIGVAALHTSAAVTWAKGLFAEEPNSVGTTVHVPATTYHPALDVRVDQVVDVRAAGLARGEHAVAVRLRVANLGDRAWPMGEGASVRLVDGLGVPHDAAARARPVGLKELPLSGSVRAHGTVEGYVVFALPQGRTAWKVLVRLAPAGEGELAWALPR